MDNLETLDALKEMYQYAGERYRPALTEAIKCVELKQAMEKDYLTVSKAKTQEEFDYQVARCAGCERPRCYECYSYQLQDALRFALKYGFKEDAK